MKTVGGKKPGIDPARSAQMALVRGKDTKPEIIVRNLVNRLGFKYRTHKVHLPGQPDLCFSRRKKVIFVHGCFWHQHQSLSCWRSRVPKTRQEFWLPKLRANQIRDRKQIRELHENNWETLVIWECQTIKSKQSALTRRIQRFLTG